MAGNNASDDAPYVGSRIFNWLDHRLNLDDSFFGKAFPEDKYGSFLLGEVALFSFVILALTGTFLGLQYNPSTQKVTYSGSAIAFAGQKVPSAFASVLHITYDTRLGMFTRMAHHWAAYLFIAAIGLHMMRVFFTGAYRNPHEPNWFVGSVLLLLALGEGYFGYALPFDNFSKTATTIGFKITGEIPAIGGALQTLIFGGEFPGNAAVVLPRMFFLHVFLIPALLFAGIATHMIILIRQKHTEHANSSRTKVGTPDKDDDSIVTGVPLLPHQAAISTIVFFLTAAVVSLLAAMFPVQRIAAIGPADLASTPQNVSPDWFFMWVFGMLKMMPSLPKALTDLQITGGFLGGVAVPGLLVTIMVLWPIFDNPGEQIHFTKDPIKRPFQTAAGVAAIELVMVLSIDGMKNTVAAMLGTTASAIKTQLLAMTIGVPLLAFVIVYVALRRYVKRTEAEATS
ncbi:MAG: cytochrome bc complex cytochrome b subunit [Halorientalis sp.]